jgi:hypothetical protein
MVALEQLAWEGRCGGSIVSRRTEDEAVKAVAPSVKAVAQGVKAMAQDQNGRTCSSPLSTKKAAGEQLLALLELSLVLVRIDCPGDRRNT